MKCPLCDAEVQNEATFCSNCGASLDQAKTMVEEVKKIYCRNCGAQLSQGSTYCTNCGSSIRAVAKPKLVLADWGKRFIAWLIDMVILGFVLGPWVSLPGFVWLAELRWIPFVDFGTKNLLYFLYWMLMDGIFGQSIGKMIMKIKVTKLDGKPVDLMHAAIESVGKAFLLPLDCIIGWFVYEKKRQRLFNYLSETIVITV
ncbi:MAG: RDD family protein [Candidatus Bathyarchaeota archaeon]|nr:MAG: RDD family protein [Candidatus Bathyarchaeota archaeon]